MESQTREGKDFTDVEVYEWLKEYGPRKLPKFDTWTRHLRVARKTLGEQRNRPPQDRAGAERNI